MFNTGTFFIRFANYSVLIEFKVSKKFTPYFPKAFIYKKKLHKCVNIP